MNTQTNAVEVEVTITSIKDLGYKQAVTSDVSRKQAEYALANIPGFPESVPEEARAQLFDGYRLRYSEKNPVQVYAMVDGHLVLADSAMASNKKLEKLKIGVEYAYSFSQQQFGQLKNDKPQLHAIVKDIRDKASKYCSNRLSDLKRQARNIQNEGKTRERGATLNFGERVTAVLNDLRDKCKTANARGDETADEKRLKEATIAFYVKWNHADAK